MYVHRGRLACRAWQVLWKPVPELISILGVDVPDPPDVTLAGIRADAATVNWTRPPANRSVQKFLIQVNGVIGECLEGPRCSEPRSCRQTLTFFNSGGGPREPGTRDCHQRTEARSLLQCASNCCGLQQLPGREPRHPIKNTWPGWSTAAWKLASSAQLHGG